MRCRECRAVLRLGHRYCDCGATLCNVCRDDHVGECDVYLSGRVLKLDADEERDSGLFEDAA